MKKFLVLLSSCLFPVLAGAQSTCETRVDAHQRATTKQRVSYCLTPDSVAADDTNVGLVFSGVSAHYPSDVQPVDQGGAKAKEGNFKPEQIVISRTYVGTAQFPQVFGDEASEVVEVNYGPAVSGEEKQAVPAPTVPTESSTYVPVAQQVEMAYVSSPTVPLHGSKKPAVTMVSAQTQTQAVTEVPAPVEHFMSDEVGQHSPANLQTSTVETKKGVLARQAKPARRWVASAAQPQTSTPSDPYTYQEDLTTPYQPEIPVGTQSYAPAVQDQLQDGAVAPSNGAANLPDAQNMQDETAAGTSPYVPVTSN